jgi:hypothetical protein
MRHLHVFRSGPVVAGAHFGETAKIYARADSLRPDDRTGRSDALYCSPDLIGVSRWLRANTWVAGSGADVAVREIAIDAAGVFIYSVSAWDLAVAHRHERDQFIVDYWATGIPIGVWSEMNVATPFDGREWEILVPESAVRGVRPVSEERVLASVPESDWTHQALDSELRRARRERR